jgi:hypothetical protein
MTMLMLVCALGLIVAGATIIYLPAGLIAAGISIAAIAVLVERARAAGPDGGTPA